MDYSKYQKVTDCLPQGEAGKIFTQLQAVPEALRTKSGDATQAKIQASDSQVAWSLYNLIKTPRN